MSTAAVMAVIAGAAARSQARPAPVSQPGPVVACSVCAAPVRAVTCDEAARLVLSDEPVPDGVHACLWHGPAGVARAHPPRGPVSVCVGGLEHGAAYLPCAGNLMRSAVGSAIWGQEL